MSNTKNYGSVKLMVRSLPVGATAEDMVALLEDIDKEMQSRAVFNKKKEELKQSDL